jgi:hypothetical protein
MAPQTIQIRGVAYSSSDLPTIYFGRRLRLAYVLNAKAASTFCLNALFFCNQGYAYFDPAQIHFSRYAFNGIEPECNPDHAAAFNTLAPETFSIVREPLRRFVSAFVSKLFTRDDPNYSELRDQLTSLYGLDLSAGANPAKSCLAFARIVEAQQAPEQIERHFRQQYFNLGLQKGFRPDTILRLDHARSVIDFFSRWTTRDKAEWLLGQRFGAVPDYRNDEFVSEELVRLVRKLYAADYEVFESALPGRPVENPKLRAGMA